MTSKNAQAPTRTPRQQAAARTIANILLETKAVNFRPAEPYTLTAGWASPVYIDCRWLISFPRARRTITLLAREEIEQTIGFESLDSVAGGETAEIPYAAWIADALMLPMQYVRKQPKGFGRDAQIEGDLKEGERVLLVEDLTTDGRSKINFCQALRSAGAVVEHVFVVFHYDIFPETKTVMSDMGVTLHALATWWDVLKVAQAGGHFDIGTMDEVEKFLRDPAGWSVKHGGVAAAPS